jgi:hypothetical protein
MKLHLSHTREFPTKSRTANSLRPQHKAQTSWSQNTIGLLKRAVPSILYSTNDVTILPRSYRVRLDRTRKTIRGEASLAADATTIEIVLGEMEGKLHALHEFSTLGTKYYGSSVMIELHGRVSLIHWFIMLELCIRNKHTRNKDYQESLQWETLLARMRMAHH